MEAKPPYHIIGEMEPLLSEEEGRKELDDWFVDKFTEYGKIMAKKKTVKKVFDLKKAEETLKALFATGNQYAGKTLFRLENQKREHKDGNLEMIIKRMKKEVADIKEVITELEK